WGTSPPHQSSAGCFRLAPRIAGNSDPIFARLAGLMGRPELVKDLRFQGNKSRVLNVSELDRLIGAWTVQHSATDLDRMLAAADIPSTFTSFAAARRSPDRRGSLAGWLCSPQLSPGVSW